MTTRAYDTIVTINTASNFSTDKIIYGTSSNALGVIVSVTDTDRINYVNSTETMNSSPWVKSFSYTVNSNGVLQSSNAFTVLDNSAAQSTSVQQSLTLPNFGIWTTKLLVKKLAYDPSSPLAMRMSYSSNGVANSSGIFFNPFSNTFILTTSWTNNRVSYSSIDKTDSWEVAVVTNLPSDSSNVEINIFPAFASNAGVTGVTNTGLHVVAQPRVEKGDTRFSNTTYQIVEAVYGLKNLKVRLDNAYKFFSVGEFINSYFANTYSVNTISNVSASITSSKLWYPIPVANAAPDSVIVYVNNSSISKYLYNIANNNVIFSTNTVLVTANSEFKLESAKDSLVIQVISNNINATSFVSSNVTNITTIANAKVMTVNYSPYIAEKNSIQQTPIVRLFTIYYPGEWYPANANGNPTKTGTGYAWPAPFPLRFATFSGDTVSDANAYVMYDNIKYKVIAADSGGLTMDSTGSIGAMSLEISNFEFNIAKLVNNKNLAGINTSNSTSAYVNGELVGNIDPRTVVGNTHYNASVAALIGANATIDYANSINFSGNWVPIKRDSRDLLKGVVEIKDVHAKFLDYWPEYSTMLENSGNIIAVRNSSLYRINDNVSVESNASMEYTITNIVGNLLYVTPSTFEPYSINTPVRIVNPNKDNTAYNKHSFIINQMEELNDFTTTFNLVSWLQYFKVVLPNRKFNLNTCNWVYKGPECKYPASGNDIIVGSNPMLTANGYFDANNVSTENSALDVCPKTLTACILRRNIVNFGGFIDVETE